MTAKLFCFRFAFCMFALSMVACSLNPPAAAQDSDDPTVYLYSYFHEPNGWDGLQLAWSEDFFNWTYLEGPHFKPTIGYDRETERGVNKVMRDCFLEQGPDGVFHLVWTSNWSGNHDIGYARSKDLVHWTDEKLLPVMKDHPNTINCWAPKLYYDAAKEQWLICWSTMLDKEPDGTERFERTVEPATSNNNRGWYTTTKDFETLDEPRVFFDPGFPVIDSMLMKDGDIYRLFFKDERANRARRGPPQPNYQNIKMATGPTPYGPWGDISGPITSGIPEQWINEGPTAIRHDGWMYVFFDHHTTPLYWGAVRSKDMVEWEVVTDKFSFPPKTKHGHIFEVKKSALAALLKQAGERAAAGTAARATAD